MQAPSSTNRAGQHPNAAVAAIARAFVAFTSTIVKKAAVILSSGYPGFGSASILCAQSSDSGSFVGGPHEYAPHEPLTLYLGIGCRLMRRD